MKKLCCVVFYITVGLSTAGLQAQDSTEKPNAKADPADSTSIKTSSGVWSVKGAVEKNPDTPAANESGLLGIAGDPTSDGFKVTSVKPRSLASQLFLTPGDVIMQVNGKNVHTGADIQAAMAAAAKGMVKVAGLTRTGVGMLPFERSIKLR